MKISCKIIQDLLPLYYDNVCSEESGVLVQEHLQECEDCKAQLESMKVNIEQPAFSDDEAKPIRAIAAVWKKDKMKSFLKGTLIALMVCAVIIGTFYALTQWKCIPVSPDLLEVSEISQLSDGRIVLHLYVNDDKNLYFVKTATNKDGSYYMTPMHSVIEGKRKGELGAFNHYYIVDIAEDNAYQQIHGDGIVITSLYLGPIGDGILIWKDGIDLPAASEELEKMFAANN
jgi:hypothetical protein